MAFKYVKHQFRTGEVVSSDRVLENIRDLASEINGNLDRDNIPSDAITTPMLNDGSFNKVIFSGQTSSYLIDKFGFQEIDPTMSVSLKLSEDSVAIVHFGCWFEWSLNQSELEDLLELEGISAANATALANRFTNEEMKSSDSTGLTQDDYNDLQEFFCDFEIRVNGITIATNEFNSLFRKRFHVSMVGVAVVPAGDLDVRVFCRKRRNKGGKIQDIDSFNVSIEDRTLLTEVKVR